MSAVPSKLRATLAALTLLAGLGGGAVLVNDLPQDVPAKELQLAQSDPYVQAVASDPTTSPAVKIAMILGYYYESSNRHIGTPYIDKAGRGQPLTVCNGITGAGVVAGRWYSQADCYRLERGRYLAAEREARRLLTYWERYDPFTQGVLLDFIHNKGTAALEGSTMRRKANAGDLQGACRENTRWNKGTVAGVLQVLGGLQIRGDSNDEICRSWRVEPHT
ncbi:endolysin [Comamonas sp. w2-DMI]|uniref:lysozyme n=1 Tax=Comamonas sp. w2-DMI TaxID=3126391 RepID=UPI0032E39DF6